MRGKSFKSQIDDLVRGVQVEAEAFAVKLGFTVNPGLLQAIDREDTWWTGQGYYGVALGDEPTSAQEARVECLDALRAALAPLSCSWGSDVLQWAETVDGEMAVLRRWAEKAASPPRAKELAEWATTYEALQAAREQERKAEFKRLKLEKELEDRAAQCKAAKPTSGLRLVKRAA